MSDEAKFSVTKNFHTLRGDSLEEFQANVESILGPASWGKVVASFQEAYGVGASEAQALQNIQNAFPNAQAAPTSTVGQPLPAPAPASPVVPFAPPTVAYPGDCQHGQRVYVDKPARGNPWRRWECAQPWQKGAVAANAARCKPVNVEG